MLSTALNCEILERRVENLSRLMYYEGADVHIIDLKEDLLKFAVYIAIADGKISYREVRKIYIIFSALGSMKKIKDYIIENEIYEEKFEHYIPESIKQIIELEMKIIDGKMSLTQDVIRILRDISRCIIECKENSEQVKRAKTYIDCIEEYLNDSVIGREDE